MTSSPQVGVGRATITPSLRVGLIGFSRRSQPSTGVQTNMFATALPASLAVAILDGDPIYLHLWLVDEIRDAITASLGTLREGADAPRRGHGADGLFREAVRINDLAFVGVAGELCAFLAAFPNGCVG
jgi:hypothetical protein